MFAFFSAIFRLWKRQILGRLFANRNIITNMIKAARFRKKTLRKQGCLIPAAVAISPTERCNLSCLGCYSRSHPKEGEITPEVLDRFVGEAIECGVALFVVTGGEPLLREDLFDLIGRYNRGLFLVITNGTQTVEAVADRMKEMKNLIPILSLEGDREFTDSRRGAGVYDMVRKTMAMFQQRKMLYGFSTVLTKSNIEYLGNDEFANTMVEAGCSLGIYNELIPVHSEDIPLVPGKEQRSAFREQLNRQRRTQPLVQLFLPEDEYDAQGRCMAVGRGAMHVNAQGWVEPCPFAHYAKENINTHTFREILESKFLNSIREHPTVLQHGDIGCSLVSNRDILEEIAAKTGAKETSSASVNHL
jgi:MoaA/NifB/PqqE/SkfB family radical SAM enzyme